MAAILRGDLDVLWLESNDIFCVYVFKKFFILEFFMSFFKNVAADKRGATAIEYALIAALIAVVSVGAFTAVGGKVGTKINAVGTALT